MPAEDDEHDGDGDRPQERCYKLGGHERIGPKDGGEEGDNEPEQGEVRDIALGVGYVDWEIQTPGGRYRICHSVFRKAVDVVGKE